MAMHGRKGVSAGTRATAISLCQDAYDQGNEHCADTLACFLYPCFSPRFGLFLFWGKVTDEKDACLHSCASVGFVVHGWGGVMLSLYLSGCIHIGILLTKHVKCSFLYSCIHLHNSFEIDLMEWRFVV